MSEKVIEKALETHIEEAKEIAKDVDKVEHLLERVEQKLKCIPGIGDKLSDIPVLVSLLRAYFKKDYTEIPIGSVLAIIAALLYFISHFDLIPDSIPGLGYFDDILVLDAAMRMAHDDVEEYRNWKMVKQIASKSTTAT